MFYGSQRLNYAAVRTVPDDRPGEVKQSKKRQGRRWLWMVGLHNTVQREDLISELIRTISEREAKLKFP